jgi:hypothetical protein
MPCTKCKDGKYKWGETGECKYDTKEACEKANPKNYKEMKQYPTPLGKTYEEYEKELKEFNLSKVEKIELGLVDDYNTRIDKAEDERKGASVVYAKTRGKMQIATKHLELAVGIAEKVEKAAKELGVDSPIPLKKVKAKYNDFKKVLDALENMKIR